MRSSEARETVICLAVSRKRGWRVLRKMTVSTFLLSLTLMVVLSTSTLGGAPVTAPTSKPNFSVGLSHGELMTQTALQLRRENNQQQQEKEKVRRTSDGGKPTESAGIDYLEPSSNPTRAQKDASQQNQSPSANFAKQDFLDASEEKLQELQIFSFEEIGVASDSSRQAVHPFRAAWKANTTWLPPKRADVHFSGRHRLSKPRALLSVSTPASPYPALIHPSLHPVYRSRQRLSQRRSLAAIPSSSQERKNALPSKQVANATAVSTTVPKATKVVFHVNGRPPVWSLERHFGWTSLEDPYYHATIAVFRGKVQNFHALYKGNVALELEKSITEYEHIHALKARIVMFAQLNSAVNVSTVVMAQRIRNDIQEQWTDHMLFYELELGEIPNMSFVVNRTESLSAYKAFLRRASSNRLHSFSLAMEEALERGRAWYSADALLSVYEQELESARFELATGNNGIRNEATFGEIMGMLQTRNVIDRQQALKILNRGLKEKGISKLAAALLNVIAGSSSQESRARNYDSVRSRRNAENDIPDSIVDDALEVVRTTGVQLLQRYRQLKHRIQTKKHPLLDFTWADTLSPTDFKYKEKYTWKEAVDICEESYKALSPKLQALFRQQLEERRIHARMTRGKIVGEYTVGVSPSVGSFQLLNFRGDMQGVLSLAHEGGHATHLALSFSQAFLDGTPTTILSEIAASSAEIKVFEHLFKMQESPTAQLGILLEHIDRLLTAIIRQAQYDSFETLVYNTYQREGILSEDRIADLWLDCIRKFDGVEGLMFTSYEDIKNLWAAVYHLYLSPFYLNSYVLAEMVAGALAIQSNQVLGQASHRRPPATSHQGCCALFDRVLQYPRTFELKYLELLRSGSTKSFVEALEPFGFSPTDKRFWENALNNYVGPLIAKAEELTLALL